MNIRDTERIRHNTKIIATLVLAVITSNFCAT